MRHLVLLCFVLLNSLLFSFEVSTGMKGIMRTVINGEEIRDFDLVIVGKTFDEPMFKEEMYIFELKDKKIKAIGGIAEGMSGSPVFMNGNLIGAVAYAIKGNRNLGLILPIKTIEENDISNQYLPGTSVAISPLRGDLYLKSSGTLTYMTKNGEVNIYSHSLNNTGQAGYFLNIENDIFIIENNDIPFKLSTTGREIGYINSDTKKGLFGYTGGDINTYKFDFSILENTQNKRISFEMVKNKNTLSLYLEKAIELALTKELDKSEYKFAEFNIEILSDNDNVIFRTQNSIIAEAAIIGSLSNTISNDILNVVDNRFKYLNFSKIDIDLKIEDESKIIYLQDVEFVKKVYTPGEDLEFEITYLIHQTGVLKKKFTIKVPQDFKVGNMTVEIYTNTGKVSEEAKNLIDYLYNLENSVKNNEVMIKLKDTDGKVLLKKKLKFDYYVISDKIFNQNIIIDSFEAKSDN